MPSLLHETLISSAAMRAHFDDQATLQAMLDFEAGLARAEESAGVIPSVAAAAIVAAAKAAHFDSVQIAVEAQRAGAVAIPLVKHLTAKVKSLDATAAGFVHFGATSQDVADTGLALQIRAALSLMKQDGQRLATALAELAGAHRDLPVLGRTLLQPGPPVTLGLKAANWLLGASAALERLKREGAEAAQLQFGGAVGTLSVLQDKGIAVSEALGRDLGLPVPPMHWHTRRDGIAGLASALGILAGTLGKIGRDISLMMQWELGEAAEPGGGGRGGSSAMPHKRNPVACMIALGAATRAPGLVAGIMSGMAQEFERALGGWQAEPAALATLFEIGHASLVAMIEAAEGLLVYPEAMERNIESLNGLIFGEKLLSALAPKLGRNEAHHLVEELVAKAIAGKAHLREVAASSPDVLAHLDADHIRALFEPAESLGSAGAFVDRALAAYEVGFGGFSVGGG